MNTNSKTLPPAATIHTPAEPIHSPITRSRSAVRKDRAKPRTPCKQSRALDIPSRRDEGPAPVKYSTIPSRSKCSRPVIRQATHQASTSMRAVGVWSALSGCVRRDMLPRDGGGSAGQAGARQGGQSLNVCAPHLGHEKSRAHHLARRNLRHASNQITMPSLSSLQQLCEREGGG